MQRCNEFKTVFWSQYISIEKEFSSTIPYVSLSEENYGVYSNEYAKLLLQIGSEIDIALKYYCKILENNFTGNTMTQYHDLLMREDKIFAKQEIQCQFEKNIIIRPWSNWLDSRKSPYWWNAYNKVKHERNEIGVINGEKKQYFKFANLENTLHSLAALYHIWICSYYKLAVSEKEALLMPLPASRIFKAVGCKWEPNVLYGDFAVYLTNDECLHIEYGTPYN